MKRILHACFVIAVCFASGIAQAGIGNKSATGEFWYDSVFDGPTHVIFNAILKSDGRVTGYMYTESASGVEEWDIQYLGIVGNRAYLSAYDAWGGQNVFIVEDNGEGSNAIPDKAVGTLHIYVYPPPGPPLAITPSAYGLLDMFFGWLGTSATAGNIQVRG